MTWKTIREYLVASVVLGLLSLISWGLFGFVNISSLLLVFVVGSMVCFVLFVLFRAIQFGLLPAERRRFRLRLFLTNYARDSGWYVERKGERFALLTEPISEEMFWDSYKVESLADDPDLRKRIATDSTWWDEPGLQFRSKEFGRLAEFGFVAGCVFVDREGAEGRVLVRGVCLIDEPPQTLWEKIYLAYCPAGYPPPAAETATGVPKDR